MAENPYCPTCGTCVGFEKKATLREREQTQAKIFARAADTEKAEAKHWREYAEKLEAAILRCRGCRAQYLLREKVRYGTHCLHPARCNPDKGADGCVCACAGCSENRRDRYGAP